MKKVDVRIGDKPDDPKFVITDLLPHLASEQMVKKATEVIKGEGMNVLVGSVPSETVDEKCSEKIKLAVMEYLNRQYGMVEADFLSRSCAVCLRSRRAISALTARSSAHTAMTTACALTPRQPPCWI